MTLINHVELWEKIARFELDDKTAERPFSKKLQEEQKWSEELTWRAIVEYKKFIFLCIVNDNGASPSKIVDEVWHTHITYTKNYQNFCDTVYGKFLHHEPAKGGDSDIHKHRSWYSDTLQSYIEMFDTFPPSDIWDYPRGFTPELYLTPNSRLKIPEIKFENTELTIASIFNSGNNVLLGGAITTLFLFIMYGNPFTLKGSSFLEFYALLSVIFLVTAYFTDSERFKKISNAVGASFPDNLSPLQLSVLFKDKNHALKTAFIDLVDNKIIEVRITNSASPVKENFRVNHNSEARLYDNPFFTTTQCPEITTVNATLFKRTLLPTLSHLERDARKFKNKITLLWLANYTRVILILLSVLRIIQGISNHKPVLFLVLLTIIMAIIFEVAIKSVKSFYLQRIRTDVFQNRYTIERQFSNTAFQFACDDTRQQSPEFAFVFLLMSDFNYTHAKYSGSDAGATCGSSSSDGGSSSCGGGGGCGGGCGGCGGG